MQTNNFFNTNQTGGTTYIEKQCFSIHAVPYDIQVNSINDKTNKEYNKNKEIIKKITITEINILKYIELTKKEKIINDVKKILFIKKKLKLLI